MLMLAASQNLHCTDWAFRCVLCLTTASCAQEARISDPDRRASGSGEANKRAKDAMRARTKSMDVTKCAPCSAQAAQILPQLHVMPCCPQPCPAKGLCSLSSAFARSGRLCICCREQVGHSSRQVVQGA